MSEQNSGERNGDWGRSPGAEPLGDGPQGADQGPTIAECDVPFDALDVPIGELTRADLLAARTEAAQ